MTTAISMQFVAEATVTHADGTTDVTVETQED